MYSDLDPQKRVQHLILIFAISVLFIKNESRFLYNFTIPSYPSIIADGHHMPRIKILNMYTNNIGLDPYIWTNESAFVAHPYCTNLWRLFNTNRHTNFNSYDIDKWNVYASMLLISCNSLKMRLQWFLTSLWMM